VRRIISVWLPEFPVERFTRTRQKSRAICPPKGLPFALVESGSKGLRLAAVNAGARQFGLARGQRLADARAAVPELLTEQHEPDKDMASLIGLCRWMERYSPWVSPDATDGILLDATGVAHLFGGEGHMLADIVQRLARYGFTARVHMGDTIGIAWALARYAKNGDSYAALPVEALRIDADSARTLRRLGLKTIGALIDLPRASLARRFRGETIHENVLLRLDELLGRRHEALNPLNPPSSFMAHRALMEPVISHEGLQSLLKSLVQVLARDLEVQGQGALRLILKLFRSDGSRVQVPVGLSAPSHDAAHVFRLLMPKLDQLDAGFGIDAMTLEARETAAVQKRQYGFMEDDGSHPLSELNDRVLNRQEREISALEAVASHIPERAEKERTHSAGQRVVEGGKKNVKPKVGSPVFEGMVETGSAASKSRPLLIFERPEPARVIASVPDGPPMRFTWRRVTRRIVKSRGPERIAPEWWVLLGDERPRDYYAIEDEEGRRYWIYREGLYGDDGAPPKWFVHGLSA
jgi:protein ImuB